MTSLIQSLINSLQSNPKFDPNEPKQYELFVCNQLLSLKQGYIEQFLAHLEQWLQTVQKSIIAAINSKQVNQIRPKLELIYTSVINQQQNVQKQIQRIGDLLGKEVYCFAEEWEQVSKEQAPKNMPKNWQKYCTTDGFLQNSGQSFLTKGRSQSIGGARRRLSKSSCFAEAKKIDIPKPQLQTGQSFSRPAPSKIKKSKKRDHSDFDYLQKCMSSTSPSNFMLNYMVMNENNEQSKSKLYPSMNKRYKANSQCIRQTESKILREGQDPKITVTDAQAGAFKRIDENSKEARGRESDNYEKVIASFEEKISQKLDLLMNKYNKIEERLEKSADNNLEKSSSSPQAYSGAQAQSVASYPSPLKQNTTYVERSPPNHKQDKQNQKIEPFKNTGSRQVNKPLHLKNKILRNRTEDSVTSQKSLEVIELQTKKQSQAVKVFKEEASPANQLRIDQVSKDKEYIESLLENYHQTTLKVLLPISKKLLFVLKEKYLAFCNRQKAEALPSILNIEAEPVTNEKVEMRDNLLKMQKILGLNCPSEKKQKLTLYVNSFLDCYLCFRRACGQISNNKEVTQRDVQEKIKEALDSIQN